MTVDTEFLFEFRASIANQWAVGKTPIGTRVVADIAGGSFEGPRLKGEVMRSGADYALIRANGSIALDVRAVLQTDDGAVIYMTYGGRLVVPSEKRAALFNPATAESVDPADYYFRTAPMFETGSEKYAWLNDIVAVGLGRQSAEGVVYQVHAVK